MKKRLLSILLVLCLVLSLLPIAAFAEGGTAAIQLGASCIRAFDSTKGYDYVYYGTWDSGPIKWRVLDTKTNMENATEGDGLFLLSDAVLANDVYFQEMSHSYGNEWHQGSSHDDGHTTCRMSNAWQGSDAQKWCNDFYSNQLTTQEQSAVLETTKSDGAATGSPPFYQKYAACENILYGDRIFYLSVEEASNGAYGFTDDNARVAYYDGEATKYWLRSPFADRTNHVGLVNYLGWFDGANVANHFPTRPAFNLDPSSVLFTSAAESGKSASGMDSGLTAVGNYDGNEWKLTLLDESRSEFTASTNAVNGNVLTVRYKKAATGENEYISAVIKDADGNITHYGRIAQLDGTTNRASGKVEIDLSGIDMTGKTLCVINEQYNGDKMTDFSSDFKDISLSAPEVPVPPDSNKPSIMIGTGAISDPIKTTIAGKGDYWTPCSYIYFGVNSGDSSTAIKWRVLDADKAHDNSTDGMFLLSEYLLANNIPFESARDYDDGDGQTNQNEWQHSDAQQWCSSFASSTSNFSLSEQAAMLGLAKTDKAEGSLFNVSAGASSLTENDKMFFLSVRELADYVGNFAPGLIAKDTAQSAGAWWLRSPIAVTEHSVGVVTREGYVSSHDVDTGLAARPAFNLDLNSVLFASAAEGGKSASGMDSNLTVVDYYDDYEWKLTLLDESHSEFSASIAALRGSVLVVKYENAVTGDNEYISAIVMDADGNITRYGRVLHLGNDGNASGTLSIALPTDFNKDTDTLCVFNEQYNGDKMTDYASAFQIFSLAGEAIDGEQFTLIPGGTYYFDLSDVSIPGTKTDTTDSGTTDTSLHYVPFTYAGTVNAYSLTTPIKITEESAQQSKYVHSLFIAEYNLTHTVNWEELYNTNLLCGINYEEGGVDYTLRAPSMGSSGSDEGGIPSCNEWDTMLDKYEGFFKNWKWHFSWGQDKTTESSEHRAARGWWLLRDWESWNYSIRSKDFGFRPVLEVLNADTLGSDGLQVVTLDLNGGKLCGSTDNIQIIVKNGAAFTAPVSDGLTRPDDNTESFFIWQADNGKLYLPGSGVPAGVSSLTAQWTSSIYPEIHEVSFDSQGGSAVASQTILHGDTATEPTAPIRTGYLFGGWYIGDVKYDFTQPVTEDITLTARWVSVDVSTEDELKEVVALGGSSIRLVADIKLSSTLNLSDKIITLDLNGHTLTGNIQLSDNSAAPDTILTLIDSDPATGGVVKGNITLTRGSGDVSHLYANGGTVTGMASMPSYAGGIYCTSDTPTAFMGYAGNYGEIHGGIFYGNVKESCIKEKTVTFMNGSSRYALEVVADGSKVIEPASHPTKAGYNFVGWYDGDTAYTFGSPLSENITLTAEFGDPISYDISYNLDGGTAVNPTTYTVESGAFTLVNPTKTGHTFTGWSGTGLSGNNNKTVTIAKGSTGNRSYTAHWSVDTYTVKLNTNGGTINSGNVTGYTYGQGAVLPTDVTKTGHTFAGWYDNAACTGEPVTAISTTATGVKEYWAKWEANQYTITVESAENGSVTADRSTAAMGDTVTLTVVPEKCYTLKTLTVTGENGSVTVKDLGNGKYSFTMPASGVSVHAVFAEGTHTLTKTASKEPTCTEAGNSEYWTCSVCGKFFSDENGKNEIEKDSWVIEATGHSLTKTEATEPTCTEAGNSAYWTCDLCHKYFSDENGKNEIEKDSWVIEATGHSLTKTEAKTPTCTEAGNSEYWTCSVCHKYFSDEKGKNEIEKDSWIIEATGHSLTKTEAKAPTCTEAGNSEYWTCSVCGKYFSDKEGTTEIEKDSWVINATGHRLTKTEATEPTCTEAGNSEYWTCSVCHKYFSDEKGKNEIAKDSWVIEATGHSLTRTEEKTPTCTEAGNSEYWTCSVCGKYFSDKDGKNEIAKDSWVIPATGHSLTRTEAKAPTCTEAGNSAYWTCDLCHKYFSDENGKNEIEKDSWIIEATGHSLTKTEATEPTCTEAGNSEYWTCSICHKYFSDEKGTTEIEKDSWVTPATGHTPGEWEHDTTEHRRCCTVCGTELAREEHTFSGSTCTVCGYCKDCDGGENCPSGKFVDVNTKAWYHLYVDYAVTHGLFGGTSANTFEPETAMTRAMLVTVLWRYEGQPKGYQNIFTDVNAKSGSWYIDAVAWAAANGVVNGTGNGKFEPEGKITREQMATILLRYAQKKGIDTSKRGDLSAFSDADKVSSYAKVAMQWAVAEGLINGSDGKLLPQGNATRAQVATILMRFIENIV